MGAARATVPAIGIDLGTTQSVIASLDAHGTPRTLTNAEGDLITPSVVLFEPGGWIVGKQALRAAADEPQRVAQFAKRNMGETAYVRLVAGRSLPPEFIQATILQQLKRDAEARVGPFDKAVITVPAYFNEPRRKATQDAGRLAGLDVIDIINEPTAAALAFGVQEGFLSRGGTSSGGETLLVYDLGGGTFDATLMRIDGDDYVTMATAGDVYLGGVDWDMRIVDFAAERFLAQFGSDPRSDPGSLQGLLLEANEAKHALTARDEVTLKLDHDGHRLRVPLSRREFEERTGPLLDRTELTVQKLLREAGVSWSDVTRVLLAGGATRMPMVAAMLERAAGRPVDRSLSPDEAVAHGAALYAGWLLDGDCGASPRLSVVNVNSHDLGVLAVEPQTGRPQRKVMIARNTPLPATGVATFATRKPGQRSVLVTVIEGGDMAGRHATRIGRCMVSDLPENLPERSPVEVRFQYAANGRLSVLASLPDAGRHAAVTIERSSGIDEERFAQWQQWLAMGRLPDEAPSGSGLPESVPLTLPTPAESEFECVDDVAPAAEASAGSEPDRAEIAAECIAIRVEGREPAARAVSKADPALQDFFKGLGGR